MPNNAKLLYFFLMNIINFLILKMTLRNWTPRRVKSQNEKSFDFLNWFLLFVGCLYIVAYAWLFAISYRYVRHLSRSYLLTPSSSFPFSGGAAATLAKYMMTFFVFSVFPAPDSPLLTTDASHTGLKRNLYVQVMI